MKRLLLLLTLTSCTVSVAEQDDMKDQKKDLYADEFELIMSRAQKTGAMATVATTKADKAVVKKVEVTTKKIEVLKEEVQTLHKENEELLENINNFGVPYKFLQLSDSAVPYKKDNR